MASRGALSGAMSGAAAGSSFGPWGAVAGGVLGGILGSGGDSERDDRLAHEQHMAALQREFAQNGVRWRVEDARAAGIHPGLALGAKTAEFTPTNFSAPQRESVSESLSRSGHNISRAVDSTRTAFERDQARSMAVLQVEHAGLQNDLLRSQIARLQRDQVGPPMADPANPGVALHGTSDVPRIVEEPLKRTMGAEGYPGHEPGAITETAFSATGDGGYAVVPSKDWKDRGEDQMVPEAHWAIRNNLIPAIRSVGGAIRAPVQSSPPRSWLPKNAIGWRYNALKGAYYPAYPRSGEDVRGKYISIR